MENKKSAVMIIIIALVFAIIFGFLIFATANKVKKNKQNAEVKVLYETDVQGPMGNEPENNSKKAEENSDSSIKNSGESSSSSSSGASGGSSASGSGNVDNGGMDATSFFTKFLWK